MMHVSLRGEFGRNTYSVPLKELFFLFRCPLTMLTLVLLVKTDLLLFSSPRMQNKRLKVQGATKSRLAHFFFEGAHDEAALEEAAAPDNSVIEDITSATSYSIEEHKLMDEKDRELQEAEKKKQVYIAQQ